MNAFNYSIIIPHKNAPNLLQRCLDSIPQRSDLQIIVVDDNSDESEVDFGNFPGCNRANVELYFTKEGGGAGYARNVGLSHACGTWLLFADADDYFNYCINDILDEYAAVDADLIFFNANSVDSQTYVQQSKSKHLNQYISLWNSDSHVAELYLRYIFGEPWCKMVRRNLLTNNGILFDETRVHNDTKFSYLVGYYAKKIQVDSRALYTYTVRSGSISALPNQKWKFYVRIDVFGQKDLFFLNHDVPIHDDRHFKALYSFLRVKDFEGFKCAYHKLVEMGFDKRYIDKSLALCLAKNSVLSLTYCICFVPLQSVKLYALFYLFFYSIPQYIKLHVLGLHNKNIECR